MNMQNERIKLGFLCLLLFLMLGILAITTVHTFQAIQIFQRQKHALATEDVHAIRSWMTIHTISHIYHVPEGYLYHTLNVNTANRLHHATLDEIAKSKKQPVDHVIQMVQHAVLTYRKEHSKPRIFTPKQTVPFVLRPLHKYASIDKIGNNK